MNAPSHPVSNRIKRWLGRDDRPSSPVPETWQQRVFTEVGAFLSANHLDPTPDNYDLGFQYRAAHNAALVSAIRAEIDRKGVLTVDAADRIFEANAGPVSADALAKFAAAIGTHAEGLSSIAKQSDRDAAAFRIALEANAASGAPDAVAVLDLTLAMVARTRAAEAGLRKSTRELAGLRKHLAEAQHFADFDPLTELANRRAFKRDLEREIGDCRARGIDLSLAFCDIDHFKRINDLHGHETGDRVLRFVAQLMAKQFARKGMVGRFGGEEFVVMFPGIDSQAAASAVDQCRADLAAMPLYAATTGDRIGSVSFTAGVVELQAEETMADLLRRADELLYRGKAAGRNRVLLS